MILFIKYFYLSNSFFFNFYYFNSIIFFLKINLLKSNKNLVFSSNFKYNWSNKTRFLNIIFFKNKFLNFNEFSNTNFKFFKNYDHLFNLINFKKRFGFFKKKFNVNEYFFKSYEFSKIHENKFLNKSNRVINKNDYIDLFDFKKNFSILLRNNRKLFLSIFNEKFKNKNSFSKKFKNFFRKKFKQIIFFFEFSLLNILQISQFFFNSNDVFFFLINNYVQINGCIFSNPFKKILLGDKISIFCDIFYFLYFRNVYNFFNKNMVKLTNYNYIFSKKSIVYGKQFKKHTPSWIKNLFYINYDIPNYIEVDFLTLTVCCIYKPYSIKEFNDSKLNFCNIFLFRLYLWKLIN